MLGALMAEEVRKQGGEFAEREARVYELGDKFEMDSEGWKRFTALGFAINGMLDGLNDLGENVHALPWFKGAILNLIDELLAEIEELAADQ